MYIYIYIYIRSDPRTGPRPKEATSGPEPEKCAGGSARPLFGAKAARRPFSQKVFAPRLSTAPGFGPEP